MKTYLIKFRSGDMVELDGTEHKRLMTRFANSGRNFARFERLSGEMFFLENIERIIPQGEDEPEVVNETADTEEGVKDKVVEAAVEQLKAELMAKSGCKHPEDLQALYKTETKSGPRFFKLCEFCGGNRSRFIALKDISDEELENVKEWVEKG